ncbi:MAG: hypothetical protein ACM3JJ_03490 [Hyphomicrobiales bacterium]
MNWKLGLTRLYYVLWILWALAWIYWSALNLVHFGRPHTAAPGVVAASNGYIEPSAAAPGRMSATTAAGAALGGSIVFEASGAPHWYLMPRPSAGQLLMLSMIGAAFPGALFLAGRWVHAGFKTEN